MSGSLQRRKKSKRKWKTLWFLLKDKVLYTFSAREVRGHRVSRTGPKTLTLISRAKIPAFIPLYIQPTQCHCLNCTLRAFSASRSNHWTTNKGILCAPFFSFSWQAVSCSALLWRSARHVLVFLLLPNSNADICYLWRAWRFSLSSPHRTKWLQKVCLCRASPWSWRTGRQERRAVTCFICTTRKRSTTPSEQMINTLHAGQRHCF